jgi:hypothetical protein
MIDPGQPTADVAVTLRWGDPDSDPAGEVRRWVRQMIENSGFSPNQLILPARHWIRIETAVARRTMTKRGFRRWRARRRAYWRTLREEPPLPDGVFERGGALMFHCRSCGEAFPLECDLAEYDPDVAYCGGSPRCLP